MAVNTALNKGEIRVSSDEEVNLSQKTTAELNKCAAREELGKSQRSAEQTTGDIPLDPETLKKMYLTGKLTQGQLAHELKKYNDVVADTIIKEGKEHRVISAVDYKDVGRASVANPGGDLKPDQSHTPQKAHNLREAKEQVRESDNPKAKKEAEKQEQQQKQQQAQHTVLQVNIFTSTQREQKSAQVLREVLRKEKEQKELDEEASESEPQERGTIKKDRIGQRIKESLLERSLRLLKELFGGARGSDR